MESFQYVFLLISICSIISIVFTGMCNRIESVVIYGKRIYISKYYCCSVNKIEKNGTCIECPIGYIVFNTTYCAACRGKTYGNKCSGICKCKEPERCDHIVGCVSDIIKSAADEYTTNEYSEETTKDKAKESNTNEFGFNKNIVLYVSISLGIVIVIVVSSVVGYTKTIRATLPKATHSIPTTNERLNTMEHHYEEINERDMVEDALVNVKSDHNAGSTDNSDNALVDEYLIPHDPSTQDGKDIVEHTECKHMDIGEYQKLYHAIEHAQNQTSGYACFQSNLKDTIVKERTENKSYEKTVIFC